jgi:hypothetical protein
LPEHDGMPDTPPFASLTTELEPYFDLPSTQVPTHLLEKFNAYLRGRFPPSTEVPGAPLGGTRLLRSSPQWDDLSSEQRRQVAQDWDYEHDPAAASVRERAAQLSEQHFQLTATIFEIEEKITTLDRKPSPTSGDYVLKQHELEVYRKERDRLLEERDRLEDGQTAEAPVPSAPETFRERIRRIAAAPHRGRKPEIIRNVVEEILVEAKARQPGFDKTQIPGQTNSLLALCKELDSVLFNISSRTFQDYVKGHLRRKRPDPEALCSFTGQGDNPWPSLFPEIYRYLPDHE